MAVAVAAAVAAVLLVLVVATRSTDQEVDLIDDSTTTAPTVDLATACRQFRERAFGTSGRAAVVGQANAQGVPTAADVRSAAVTLRAELDDLVDAIRRAGLDEVAGSTAAARLRTPLDFAATIGDTPAQVSSGQASLRAAEDLLIDLELLLTRSGVVGCL